MEPLTLTMSRSDPAEAVLVEAIGSAIMVSSGAVTPPLRDSRKVSTGYKMYCWPRREYWHHIILGREQAWMWFRTLAGPPEFMGSLSLAIRRWYPDD